MLIIIILILVLLYLKSKVASKKTIVRNNNIICLPKTDILTTVGKQEYTTFNLTIGIHQFTYNLLHEFNTHLRRYNRNYVFSPFGMLNVAMLVIAGANSYAVTELRNSFYLYLKSPHDKIHLITTLAKLNQLLPQVKVSNSVLINKCVTIKDIYKEIASALGDVCFVDFDRRSIIKEINNMIEYKTGGLITNSLDKAHYYSDKTITYTGGLMYSLKGVRTYMDDMRMIIINSIVFRREWVNKFDLRETKQELYRSGNEQRVVDMMHQQNMFGYFRDEKAEIVKMDYADMDVSMYLILPWNPIHDPTALPSEFIKTDISETKWTEYFIPDHTDFELYCRNMRPTMIDLKMPKFREESNMDLKDVFGYFGVKQLFEDPVLNDMSPDNDMNISRMLQRNIIDINETGINVSNTNNKREIPKYSNKNALNIHIDNTFLYYIIHNSSKNILFAGIYG